MPGAALTPRVRIIAICDAVQESLKEAGVFNLKGVRHEVSSDRFPFSPSRLWLFLLLSSSRSGKYRCYIRIVEDLTERTIFYSYLVPQPVFESDATMLATRAKLRCTFPAAGWYTVQVWFFQRNGVDVLKGETPFHIKGGEEA